MNPGHNKNIDVPEICVRNKVAFINCKIPKYKDIIKRIEIGEYITTTHPFDILFQDFTSKWTIFLFPRGQYDYGIASENIRVYIKNLSYEKPFYEQMLKINICIKSSVTEYSSNPREFAFNDSSYQCVGPFQIESIKDNELNENLTISLTFELSRKQIHLLSPEGESKNLSKKRFQPNVFPPKGRSKVQLEHMCPPRRCIFSSEERANVHIMKYEQKTKCLSVVAINDLDSRGLSTSVVSLA